MLALVAGCTTSEYARQADQTAHGTLSAGQKAAMGQAQEFDVGYRPFERTSPEVNEIRIGQKAIPLRGSAPVILTPEDCLRVAFRNARDLQAQKETLYSSAMDVAAARRAWDGTLLTGGLTGAASTSVTEGTGRTDAASAGANVSWAQKFVDGGAIALGTSLDLASDLTGIANTTAGSLLTANFTQPLLRGARRGLAYETQYRMERDFLFGVYSYGRFQETFSAGIATRYYSLLQTRDQLENQKQNLGRLRRQLEVSKILVEGGQTSKREQDQSEQSVLSAEIAMESAVQSYRDQLDSFKLLLGLPMSAGIEVDYPAALKSLIEVGPKGIPFEEAEAIEVALATRPDVMTQRAALRDAERNVVIAADAFLPQLDVALTASVPSQPPRDFWASRFDRHTRGASVIFNYPLDQTDNRNAYRKSLLALELAKRSYTQFVDQVRLEVRQSHRTLLQSRRSYEIQQRNVQIAVRRTRLVNLERRAGQASARDVLDAEADLLSAQNGLTSQLVTYTTTRMQFLATLGMVRVESGGRVEERDAPFRFDVISRRYAYVMPAEANESATTRPATRPATQPSDETAD